jgi:hypothetical protein
MKKYLVLMDFNDKNTDKFHAKGSEFETSSEERAQELIELGYLKKFKEEPKKPTKEKAVTAKDKKNESEQTE